jgi:uncharacterized protein (DUF4415 family)
MSNTVKYRLDPANLPPLTDRQKAELATLAQLPDEQIDTSDIAELPAEFWSNATRGRFYKPLKSSTTVRVDADVLAWLKSHGKGYQTRINTILRDAMLRTVRQETSQRRRGKVVSVK